LIASSCMVVRCAALRPAPLAQICEDHKFSLAGVEYGHQCMCGNAAASNAKEAPAADCGMACSANATQKCGGSNRMDVYSFQCAGPPDPTPTPPPPPPPKPPTDQNLCPDFSREYCSPSVPLEERIGMVSDSECDGSMPCPVFLYRAMPRHAMPMPCHAMPCHAMPFCAVPCQTANVGMKRQQQP
jgi:hypothetical protein